MRTRLLPLIIVGAVAAAPGFAARPIRAQQGPVTFSNVTNLVYVDVDVRDKKGQPIKGLQQSDFEVFEDGKPQEIRNFKFEEIAPTNKAVDVAATLSRSTGDKNAVPIVTGLPKPAAAKPVAPPPPPPPAATPPASEKPIVDADAGPLKSEEVAGHRVWVMLLDTSSMEPEDVQKAMDSATKWANERMSMSDIVAVATVSSTLQIVQDFTNDKSKVLGALRALSQADGTASAATDVDTSTMATDEAQATATASDTTTVDQSAQEIDSFNNDVRLRAIKTVCDNLNGIDEKKAMMYFSSGMQRNGSDNQVELRAMEQSCNRANVQIDTVDARGLQAVVAGGNGRQGSRGGLTSFNGKGVASQFSTLAAQQETLQAMASDTGGTAFTDSNDFGEAFDAVEKQISAYYLIGYSSTNQSQDGHFRRIEVKLKTKIDGSVKAREGYYADRDFGHTAKEDRETELMDQLDMAIPDTDVPVLVKSSYFRLSGTQSCPGGGGRGRGGRGGGPGGRGGPGADEPDACYYVPVSITVPGDALPVDKDKAETLDVRGWIRDERRMQVATIHTTLTVPPAAAGADLAARQVLYQTGASMPPGGYDLKVVIRENTTGKMGAFETPIIVPDLKKSPVKVSAVVLSTQLQTVPPSFKTMNPLVQGGIEIMPNLTHVVDHDQKLYFYYEVYDPSQSDSHPQIRTSLAFYNTHKVKVFETSVVERTTLDAPDRKAAIFSFEIPANSLKPGVYTCQVNVIDEIAGKFAFPSLLMYVR